MEPDKKLVSNWEAPEQKAIFSSSYLQCLEIFLNMFHEIYTYDNLYISVSFFPFVCREGIFYFSDGEIKIQYNSKAYLRLPDKSLLRQKYYTKQYPTDLNDPFHMRSMCQQTGGKKNRIMKEEAKIFGVSHLSITGINNWWLLLGLL